MIKTGMLIVLSLLAAGGGAVGQAPVKPKPLVIAHRGASGYLPEHTLPAVAMAHAMGADYIEQDVVLSKDGVPVVLHDIHIDTVTDVAKRFPMRKRADSRYYGLDFTLAELKSLNVSERFDYKTGRPVFPNRFPTGQSSFSIPTLEEELQLVQGLNKSTGKNVGVYPEIKAPAWHREQGRDISPVVIEMLAKYGYKTRRDRCYLQCFEYAEVKRIRNELGYQGKLVQLIGANNGEDGPTDFDRLRTRVGLEEIAKVADGIGPSLAHVVFDWRGSTPHVTDLVKNAHALKLEVHPYTFRADRLPAGATTFDELLRAFVSVAGVDGLFTDQPDRVAAWLVR